MVVTILKEVLRDALLVAERFLGKQLTLPIIGNILLKTEQQKLRIQATNLEMGVDISLPAKVTKEGMIAIPPRVLSTLLQSLQDEKVTLEERQNTLKIETDLSQSEIRGISGKEFPLMPTIKPQTKIILKNSYFIPQLIRVLPAISPSDFKPEISGVLFRIDKKDIVIVGTDTFRLAEARIKEFEADAVGTHIIPLRPLQELVRIADPEEETEFVFGDGQVSLQTSGVRIVSRLITGRYPEYEALIPKDFATTMKIPRNELLSAVRLSGVFASKLNDIILTYRANHLAIEIVNPEIGRHTKELTATVSGKSGRVGFNYRYLSDALEALHSEDVTVSITDETRPALIRDEADIGFFTILMPIRIS